MLIDPFVVVAQLINFLILVALLKRFLYQPITQIMEARSQRIERQLATAANKEQEAEAEKKLYLQKQQELSAQKQAWLEKAKQEVELKKEQLTQQAQAEVDQVRSQWYRTLEQDRDKFARQLREQLGHQIAVTTRKALSDLANANLETQIIDTFIDQLNDLNDSQLKTIRATPIPNPHHIITIRSSFVIPYQEKEQLFNVIQKQIAANAEVEFETVENLLCGIELRDRGYKISWNLENYLTELDTETAKFLAENNNK